MAESSTLTTRPLTQADFYQVVAQIDHWWGGPTTAMAHPVFFYELGELARVAVDGHTIVGFLFGFVAGDVGYVHLVGIHPSHRRRGVARSMYEAFERDCVARGAKRMKAITTLGNDGSVRFHEALGWTAKQLDDYAGLGRARIVFTKKLAEG
jgi:ribosomal protein S18 acetylase RimI-like enzyme